MKREVNTRKILFLILLTACLLCVGCKGKNDIGFSYNVLECHEDGDNLSVTIECEFNNINEGLWIYKDGSWPMEVEETSVSNGTLFSKKVLAEEKDGWSGWGYNPVYPEFLFVSPKEKIRLTTVIDFSKAKNARIKTVEYEIYLFDTEPRSQYDEFGCEAFLNHYDRKADVSVPYESV